MNNIFLKILLIQINRRKIKYKYFSSLKKFLIPFCLFGCVLNVEASTYNLSCNEERSFVLSYEDIVSSDDDLISGQTKFKENKNKSLKKFNVSYDLNKGTGSIENVNLILIRELPVNTKNVQEKVFHYRSPLYLYQSADSINQHENSQVVVGAEDPITESSFSEYEQMVYSIRIDNPKSSLTQFFAVKTIDKETSEIILGSNDQGKDTLEINKTLEISIGLCSQK